MSSGAINAIDSTLPYLNLYLRLQGYVDASVNEVFKEVVVNIESSPSWNPTLIECRVRLFS